MKIKRSEKLVKKDSDDVRVCRLCMRELKKGVYRLNDSICPEFSEKIPKKRTCMEQCELQNKELAESFFKLAEKKRLEQGNDSSEALIFEDKANALLKCGKIWH